MKKTIAIYPGTFDPVTYGHLDILERATRIFDKVIVGLAADSAKKTLFSLEERISLFRSAIQSRKFHAPVELKSFHGLLIKFAKKEGATTLVRGLRAVSDFEYEFQLALMNRNQNSLIETVFLMPDEKYVYLSSSIVKEVSRLHGNLKGFLPPAVVGALQKKFSISH